MFSCFHFHSSVDNQQCLITSLACYEVAQKSKWGVWPESCMLLNQQNTSVSLYMGLMAVDSSVIWALFRAFKVLLIALGLLPKLLGVVLHMQYSLLLGLPTGHQAPFFSLLQELKAHSTDGWETFFPYWIFSLKWKHLYYNWISHKLLMRNLLLFRGKQTRKQNPQPTLVLSKFPRLGI